MPPRSDSRPCTGCGLRPPAVSFGTRTRKGRRRRAARCRRCTAEADARRRQRAEAMRRAQLPLPLAFEEERDDRPPLRQRLATGEGGRPRRRQA